MSAGTSVESVIDSDVVVLDLDRKGTVGGIGDAIDLASSMRAEAYGVRAVVRGGFGAEEETGGVRLYFDTSVLGALTDSGDERPTAVKRRLLREVPDGVHTAVISNGGVSSGGEGP